MEKKDESQQVQENKSLPEKNEESKEITITIKAFNKSFEIKIKNSETIKKLKEIIEAVNQIFLRINNINTFF